ncbi:SlyX family protein [Emcibacter nanhaiensis]|uniref:SlyX family protein n=1 Tax=Emcibacter nanhaiensis TaxID=1505037 RepID=A0A501PP30_9PROT|nr:SlyX family protein [Emcibacter nanhaiensis]TPD61521.1 SlyX family protein [Emcibacter nanhaiensis]
MTDTSDKLTDLEIRLAHQDQQIHDLSDMVTRQWHEIDRLKKSLQKTESRLSVLEEDADEGQGPVYEKPPHY